MFFASFLKLTLDYHTAWFFTEFFELNFYGNFFSNNIFTCISNLFPFNFSFFLSTLEFKLGCSGSFCQNDILVRIGFYQLIYMSCNASYVRL